MKRLLQCHHIIVASKSLLPIVPTISKTGTVYSMSYTAPLAEASIPPEASNVQITGTLETGQTITITFDYYSPSGTSAGSHIYTLWKVPTLVGDLDSTKTLVYQGTSNQYTLTEDEQEFYLLATVLPIDANNVQSLSGAEPGDWSIKVSGDFIPRTLSWTHLLEMINVPSDYNTNGDAVIPDGGSAGGQWVPRSGANKPDWDNINEWLDFDAANDEMLETTTTPNTEQPYELWIRFKLDVTTGYSGLIATGNTQNIILNSNDFYVRDGGSSLDTGVATDTDWHVMRMVGKGDATSYWQLDGGSKNSFTGSDFGNYAAKTWIAELTTYFTDVKIAFAGRMESELTSGEETDMWSYASTNNWY